MTRTTERATRALELGLAVAGAGLVAFLLFHLTLFRFGMDQAIFAVIGDGLVHGELPYRDRWSMRTPGVLVLYSLGHGEEVARAPWPAAPEGAP